MLVGRTGWLQGDGYAGYAELYAREGGPVEVGCWMHGRRGLKQALDGGDRRAARGLGLIAEMYQVERVSKELGETFEQRRLRREQDTRPILNRLGEWIAEMSREAPKRTPLGKALFYLAHRWTALTRALGLPERCPGQARRRLAAAPAGRAAPRSLDAGEPDDLTRDRAARTPQRGPRRRRDRRRRRCARQIAMPRPATRN